MAHELLAPWAELVPDAPYPMTAADLARLPEDGWKYELVRGRLVRMPPTTGGHGSITAQLARVLGQFIATHHMGEVLAAETGFRLAGLGDPEHNVYAPDVSFVRADRVPARNSPAWDDYWELAPDLVVEVASKSQYRPDMAKKAREWLTAGVRLVWVVWPKSKQVDVWLPGQNDPAQTLKLGDALDGRDVVPGFSYPLVDLFA